MININCPLHPFLYAVTEINVVIGVLFTAQDKVFIYIYTNF